MEDRNLESTAELSHLWYLFNNTLSLIFSALQTSLQTIGFWNSQMVLLMFTAWKPKQWCCPSLESRSVNWTDIARLACGWLCISSPPTSFRALSSSPHQALWGQWLGDDTKEMWFLYQEMIQKKKNSSPEMLTFLLVFSYGIAEGPEFNGCLEEGCFFP